MKVTEVVTGILGAIAIMALAIFLWLSVVELALDRALNHRDLFHCPQTTTPQPEGQGDEGKRDA